LGTTGAKGKIVEWQTGDVNNDGQVDFSDLTIVAQYFGDSLAKTQAALAAGTAMLFGPPSPPVRTAPNKYMAAPPALVVHAPRAQVANTTAMPSDLIGNDAIVGVWSSLSHKNNLLW